ncbi:Peptidyl-prolyl cis-trans isomerase [Labilithrix luteola]|uniref:peptidylprolyl isomerase n=1 Tax=Labilithrix luteola TaxID=1391654 RepID=A0A0K1PUV6_9BACT|nr:peptidylprolyl isomerase [Labilithrix luteola]AKU97302.1 Peptidyl-prolyl cis-trans isomerase [Labilithrix luteola]
MKRNLLPAPLSLALRAACAVGLGALLVPVLVACKKTNGAQPDAGDAGAASVVARAWVGSIARAEDTRHAKDVGAELRTSHDVEARRASARALARIADGPSLEGLAAHLADEDAETVAWAAYGLGYGCKGHEDAHVKMLAARAASLDLTIDPRGVKKQRGVAEIDPHVAIARAIGRCGGGPLAEQVLVPWLTAGPAWEEAAALGLGDLATRRKQLGEGAMTALLEAAARRAGPGGDGAPVDASFYPLSRVEPGETFGRRVADAAKAALLRPGDGRIFAIKALGKSRGNEKDVGPDLVRVVIDAKGFTAAERAEAARALGNLGEVGQLFAADALARLTPDKDPVAIEALGGSEFHVLYALIGALGAEPPKKAEPALGALSRLSTSSEPRPSLARRLAELRCSAALALSRAASDAEILRKCDDERSAISQHARLTALLRRPITHERKNAFRAFSKSEHLRIREQAVDAIDTHAELGELAATVLAEALTSNKAGLVATAAEVLHSHPDRAMVLAESEKRAALDPRSPPPTDNPKQEISSQVLKALSAALATKWPEDRFETRIALIEAAASLRHPEAKAAAMAGCSSPNVVVRERATKALRSLGENVTACEAAPHELTAAPEIDKAIGKPMRITFVTDAAELGVTLEPELSPVTATRIASLARSGFYKGIVIHRVVPGFVAQFGDPDGDGYGGSGTSLRCETSPVPFAPFDVGMALAGRDTGSSQLFITLSRTPHLDGEYTRVGHADGDWASVAEGDVITDVRVGE